LYYIARVAIAIARSPVVDVVDRRSRANASRSNRDWSSIARENDACAREKNVRARDKRRILTTTTMMTTTTTRARGSIDRSIDRSEGTIVI